MIGWPTVDHYRQRQENSCQPAFRIRIRPGKEHHQSLQRLLVLLHLSPVALLKSTLPEFKEYGNKEIKILADHFFKRRKRKTKKSLKHNLKQSGPNSSLT